MACEIPLAGKWILLRFMCSSSYQTPEYGHVHKYRDVYEPSEDTFLMLDALEKDSEFLQNLRYIECSFYVISSEFLWTFWYSWQSLNCRMF